jgi:hypothetical protein
MRRINEMFYPPISTHVSEKKSNPSDFAMLTNICMSFTVCAVLADERCLQIWLTLGKRASLKGADKFGCGACVRLAVGSLLDPARHE